MLGEIVNNNNMRKNGYCYVILIALMFSAVFFGLYSMFSNIFTSDISVFFTLLALTLIFVLIIIILISSGEILKLDFGVRDHKFMYKLQRINLMDNNPNREVNQSSAYHFTFNLLDFDRPLRVYFIEEKNETKDNDNNNGFVRYVFYITVHYIPREIGVFGEESLDPIRLLFYMDPRVDVGKINIGGRNDCPFPGNINIIRNGELMEFIIRYDKTAAHINGKIIFSAKISLEIRHLNDEYIPIEYWLPSSNGGIGYKDYAVKLGRNNRVP